MALFPMTFPFYFDEAPAPVYPPFRPLTEEEMRTFGTTPEDPRTFLDPAFSVRVPDVVTTIRAFDGSVAERVFSVDSIVVRPFDDSDSTGRTLGTDASPSRRFDDEHDECRF